MPVSVHVTSQTARLASARSHQSMSRWLLKVTVPPIILAMDSTLLLGLFRLSLSGSTADHRPPKKWPPRTKAWACSNDRLSHWWFQDPLVGSTRSPHPFSHLFLAILTATVSLEWASGTPAPAAVQLSINLSVARPGRWLTAGAKEGGKEGRQEPWPLGP